MPVVAWMTEPCGAKGEAASGWPWRTYLITPSTAGLLAVTVMSATVQLPILPEVNHVDQEFTTGAADETGWVPEFVVASPFSIDSWVSFLHDVSAAVTGLGQRTQTRSSEHGHSAPCIRANPANPHSAPCFRADPATASRDAISTEMTIKNGHVHGIELLSFFLS